MTHILKERGERVLTFTRKRKYSNSAVFWNEEVLMKNLPFWGKQSSLILSFYLFSYLFRLNRHRSSCWTLWPTGNVTEHKWALDSRHLATWTIVRGLTCLVFLEKVNLWLCTCLWLWACFIFLKSTRFENGEDNSFPFFVSLFVNGKSKVTFFMLACT